MATVAGIVALCYTLFHLQNCRAAVSAKFTRQVKPKQIVFQHRQNLQYYDMSVKTAYNVEKPMQYLIRKLMGDSGLEVEAEVEPAL